MNAFRAIVNSALCLLCALPILAKEPAKSVVPYARDIAEDKPVASWSFQSKGSEKGESSVPLQATVEGYVGFEMPGPRPGNYPRFDKSNNAILLNGQHGFIRVKDPGENSVLDFDLGDSITLEAWIKPASFGANKHIYIVGKGRTKNPNVKPENQNYAMRLTGEGATARLSFLFRNKDNQDRDDFHRWASSEVLLLDNFWHHLAVTYTFGDGKSLRGYLDGREVTGKWDMGGATDKGPVVDNDELWIGSSYGAHANCTFDGLIDEVAIYRTALSAERLKSRYEANVPDPRKVELSDENVPTDSVLVEIAEGIPGSNSWAIGIPTTTDSFHQDDFAFVAIPKKYVDGLIHDRSNPFLVQARTKRKLPAGKYDFLLRTKSASRLWIDGKIDVENAFMSRNSSGHEKPPELKKPPRDGLCFLLPDYRENLVTVDLDEGEHVFRFETIVGGKGMREEIGEAYVGVAPAGKSFELLATSSSNPVELSEHGWLSHLPHLRERVLLLEQASRAKSSETVDAYWKHRHELAREEDAKLPKIELPKVADETTIRTAVDRFINAKLEKENITPLPPVDDYTFLRRVTLDTVGTIPTRDEIDAFMNDTNPNRRQRVVERLLNDRRWADHWVSYWQDVLAENPGILKPKLNNSGPFRWWIYESLVDNKAMDRFATELIMMRGSKYGGGPAGFAMATQNDVPMAAKAQIIGKAFLGLEMKCARCHDAPFHSYRQEDLFHLASMLDKKTIKLPATSTVPIAEGARKPAIKISLKPGASIDATWPFEKIGAKELPNGILRNPNDSRERLAATITSPQNLRFAKVLVNRLWHRWLGRGLVDPVDDWENGNESHNELLEFLARDLVANNYDLKHVASLILNSGTYQRQVMADETEGRFLWAGQIRRRMSAEQVVDSMFGLAGKSLKTEMLTLDPEGRRSSNTFLNLGAPQRAWGFVSLSNERDRPALALPMAQSILDVLLAYGWRDSRPNPTAERDEEPTMLQPLAIANGIAGTRIATLSDDHALTQVCVEETDLKMLADKICLQVLSRLPTDDERETIVTVLSGGFSERVNQGVLAAGKSRRYSAVSWSNHLSARASEIQIEMERAARAGDEPTKRLNEDWRERAEDVVWALFNSPEFIFIP